MKHALLAILSVAGASFTASGQQLSLRLPTANDALYRGDLEAFYMPTDLANKPAESGSWGFVRNVREFSNGRVYTRFHEGLDIRPVARDSRGIPTDPVKAIAKGKVVHVNATASRSNYGKYVVVEHNFGHGPICSLYAHLASTAVQVGQQVSGGTVLGILGSTGSGLNNSRAHVHLELGIVMSERFGDWMQHFLKAANVHGNHNGLNMSGIDLADIFLKSKNNAHFNLAKHIHALPQHYRITVPRTGGVLPIVRRYPWMRFGNHEQASKSWELAFTRSGFLIGVAPSSSEVSKPTVTYVRSTRIDHKYYTIGRLTGTGSTATLTSSGERFIALVTDEFPNRN